MGNNLMGNNLLFGGKPFILGGDFRQTPPVVHKGTKMKTNESSIKKFVNKNFKKINLTKNMRADPNAKEFAEWLLKIGNGTEQIHTQFSDEMIKLPRQCVIKKKSDFIDELFGGVNSIDELKDTVCLSTTNEIVGELNKEIQNRIVPGAITQKIS